LYAWVQLARFALDYYNVFVILFQGGKKYVTILRKEYNMNIFRCSFRIGFLLTLLLSTGTSIAQQCDQCSHPRVALYDAQILVPKPSTADSIIAWWRLQWPMVVARVTLHNSDPSRDCITWYDGALVNARDVQGDTLRFGVGHLNIPSAGEVNGADYLLTGLITGSEGTYTLNMVLETAVSREVALTQSVTYGYDLTSQESAAQILVAAFSPLFQNIRNYEVNKRNTDVAVAIRDMHSTTQDIIVTPKKNKINVGDSVDVDIEMIDCDGVPLGNREIYFVAPPGDSLMLPSSTGGTVEPSSITTDASGKAKVKFTAGNTNGLGQIVASYTHKKPCGRTSAFLGSAAVVIGQPPKNRWLVHAGFYERVERLIDTIWAGGNATGSETLTDISEGNALIDALVENLGEDTTSFYFVCYEESGDTFENATISGTMEESYFYRYYVEAGLPLPDVTIRVENYFGAVSPGETGFEFHYPNKPTDVAIVAQCGGTVQGSTHIKYTYCCPEYHWEESNSSTSTGLSVYTEFNANECTITKSPYSYSVVGTRTRTVYSGPQKTRRTVVINATISLYDSPTGVEQMDKGFPTSFNLQQNHPNPFNPSTKISYELPFISEVSLKVYDLLGREVAKLVNEKESAGTHTVTWNAGSMPNGVYFYTLQAGSFKETKKLILLR
jgi:hypothetical protein